MRFWWSDKIIIMITVWLFSSEMWLFRGTGHGECLLKMKCKDLGNWNPAEAVCGPHTLLSGTHSFTLICLHPANTNCIHGQVWKPTLPPHPPSLLLMGGSPQPKAEVAKWVQYLCEQLLSWEGCVLPGPLSCPLHCTLLTARSWDWKHSTSLFHRNGARAPPRLLTISFLWTPKLHHANRKKGPAHFSYKMTRLSFFFIFFYIQEGVDTSFCGLCPPCYPLIW